MRRSLIFILLLVAAAYILLMKPFEDLEQEEPLFSVVERDVISHPVKLISTDSLAGVITVERDVKILMSDSINLSANIYRPNEIGRYPVVLAFTAYGKDRGPDDYPSVINLASLADFDLGSFEVSEWTAWESPDPAFWVPNGYVLIHVDARGFYLSEGEASLFDEQNRQDFHQIIEWAGSQSWCNGHVGLNGVSYLAMVQWLAASGNPPKALKAIIPWEGASNPYWEVLFHGGIPETSFTRFWVENIREGARTPPLPPYDIFKMGLKHPWLLRKFREPPQFRLKEIAIPTLVCGSWSDHGLHTEGSFNGYEQIAPEQKWLFTHGRQKWDMYYSEEGRYYQKRFFDYFLKGEANGMDTVKAVRLEVRENLNTYEVRHEERWPIPDTRYRKLYLDVENRSLVMKRPADSAVTMYEPMAGNAVFTHRFEEDTEITGSMKVSLWIATTEGWDMDVFLAVRKLDSLGEEVNFYAKNGYKKGPVAMGWLRVSEYNLDTAKSAAWYTFFTNRANENLPMWFEIEILPSSTLFREGESLQLVVQGKDFFIHPLLSHHFSANVNHLSLSSKKRYHKVYAGGVYDSYLEVPVVPR